MSEGYHRPVLLKEVVDGLALCQGEVVVDATLGFGGHAQAILKIIGPSGKLVGLEKDPDIIGLVSKKIKAPNLIIIQGDFRKLKSLLEKEKVFQVNKILFDLGISSYHFDLSGRGFSFGRDEPLDMRLNTRNRLKASDFINGLTEKELADLFYNLADEYRSRAIAEAIIRRRKIKKIETTRELSEIIEKIKGKRREKIHPATKVFQALRITVNDELNALLEAIPQAIKILKKRGRLAVISFHSGEDRIVKNQFKKFEKLNQIKPLFKKPIVASEEEKSLNPRSRSAKLRIIERI